MLVVLFNNLPQLIGLLLWSSVMVWCGVQWQRWRTRSHWFSRAKREKQT